MCLSSMRFLSAAQRLLSPLTRETAWPSTICRQFADFAGQDKALALLRHLPAVTFANINHTMQCSKKKRHRGRYGGKTHGCGQKGAKARQRYAPAGYDGRRVPYFMKVPSDEPYRGYQTRRQYLPISLHEVQVMVDVDRIDCSLPIDITQLCRTGLFKLDPMSREFGFQLTDQGMDNFKAVVHLEVQYATERVIAAVERAGGSITTAYYDAVAVTALNDPEKFFKTGRPIPRRMLPPQDSVGYYTDAANRGYLADPALVAADRLVLAQKYGYQLTPQQMMGVDIPRKDARQIFYGLEPGWLVNLADKTVLQVNETMFKQYYCS